MVEFGADARSFDIQDTFKQWLADRIAVIHEHATAADVLQRNGVKLRYNGQRPESILCPFHGNTKSMAARFHPADARKPDHVWCFVCNEQWDAISLTKKFENYQGKFSGLLRIVERDYGIVPPETPTEAAEQQDQSEQLEVIQLFEICERRLKGARQSFELRSYLLLGSVLDRTQHAVTAGTMSLSRAKVTLRQVLDKIAERVRSSPEPPCQGG